MDAGSRSGVFGGTAGSFSQLGGASNASSSVTQSSGLFGAGNPSNQSGLFGQTSVTKGNSGTLFGGSPTTGTTFGGSTTTGTLFSGSPNSGTMFGGSSQTSSMKITNQSGGLFGASTAGPSPDGGSLFGSPTPAVSSGSFSNGSVPQTVNNRTDSQSINVSANSLVSEWCLVGLPEFLQHKLCHMHYLIVLSLISGSCWIFIRILTWLQGFLSSFLRYQYRWFGNPVLTYIDLYLLKA